MDGMFYPATAQPATVQQGYSVPQQQFVQPTPVQNYFDKLCADTNAKAFLMSVQANNDRQLAAQKFAQEQQLQQQQEERQLRIMETIEKNRERRELTTESFVEDSDGKIRIMRVKPDGESTISQPVINISRISSEILVAAKCPLRFVHVKWRENPKGAYMDADATSKVLAKRLRQAGVMFEVPKDKCTALYDLLHSHVMGSAVVREIPRCFGWNKMCSGNWVFANARALTMERVREEVNKGVKHV